MNKKLRILITVMIILYAPVWLGALLVGLFLNPLNQREVL